MLTRAAVLFVDRDGTLIEEPADEQVDTLEKVRFMPGVFAALAALRDRGFRFAMVTNQDGLGGAGFPRDAFERPQRFVLDAFASQGLAARPSSASRAKPAFAPASTLMRPNQRGPRPASASSTTCSSSSRGTVASRST